MPAVADQKPTTGTRAIGDALGLGLGRVWALGIAAFAGFGSGASDGCHGAQDITTATSAAAPIHCRVIRDRRTGPA